MANNGTKTRQTETRLAAQLMKRILIHFRSQMDEALRPQGVTTAQLHILKTIHNEPGVSGAQLARACYVTPQSAQSLLQGLEEGGWIVRVKDKVNDRIRVAQLTQTGETLLETAEKAARIIENRVWKGVSDEAVGSLNRLLEQCLGNLELES
ncbi:MAG TPA: MarR family transcriptional regulator [Edaphobacter sp.]|jgi:DNA-binding MarR family transcriptional regulator|nr:MarR family transcriptional regulator [Edaphobacter sp.]